MVLKINLPTRRGEVLTKRMQELNLSIRDLGQADRDYVRARPQHHEGQYRPVQIHGAGAG